MKTNNIILKTIVTSMCILLLIVTGCVKDSRSEQQVNDGGCSEEWLRGFWMTQGVISNTSYNRTKDLRGYYLNHRDSSSFHRYDNDTVKVWGYRWCDCYPITPYYDSTKGDTVLLIALATRPLRYDKYSTSHDPSFYYLHDTACVIMTGDEIVQECGVPLPDTIHAYLRGADIETALSNPDKRLLLEGTLDVKQTTINLFNCSNTPDCSIGLNVFNLEISEEP